MMWDNNGSYDVGGWLLMGFLMVAFWAGIAALLVWAVRTLRSAHRGPGSVLRRPADSVLAERFARGEIDDEEFRRRRDALHAAG